MAELGKSNFPVSFFNAVRICRCAVYDRYGAVFSLAAADLLICWRDVARPSWPCFHGLEARATKRQSTGRLSRNNLLRKYIYGPGIDQPVCMIEQAESETNYYHYDALGSVVALSDSSGDTVQTYEYSVYGQVAVEDINHPNPYMFAGRRFDIEIGLYYNRARYYNPYTGRFLQADPIGYRGGMNLYTYCVNRPTQLVDPSGLAWEDQYIRIVLYDSSEVGDDGVTPIFDETLDDGYWDVEIDIAGLELQGLLDIFDQLQDEIISQMEAADKEFDWEQITIEGLWIFDHEYEYGAVSAFPGKSKFNKLWSAMGEALDNNHGKNAIIHLRQCKGAENNTGRGSAMEVGAQVSGHSVTGSIGDITWYELGRPGLPDYASEGGYRIAIPVGSVGSGNYTVRDYYNTHVIPIPNPAVPGQIIYYPWTSNTIVW